MRYIADQQYGVKRLKRKYSTRKLWGKSKYLRSNSTTEFYSHKCGFTTVYHMKKSNNKNTGHSLGTFIRKYVLPEHLTYDGAAVQVVSTTIFKNHVRKNYIQNQR